MKTQWTLFSERPPLSDEFPVRLGKWEGDYWKQYHCTSPSELPGSNCTHWCSVRIDPPAQRVRSQLELDEKAFEEWFVTVEAGNHTRGAWHAALAHERAEVKRGAP